MLWSLLVSVCITAPLSFHPAAAQPADKQELLKKARAAYYSLLREGFTGLQCDMEPNWELIFGDLQKTDPAKFNFTLARLRMIKFSVTVGADGVTKIGHNDPPADNKQMADNDARIENGLQQSISGYFGTWIPYVMSSPFPSPGTEIQREDAEDHHRISYKNGTADIVIAMGKDLIISSIDNTGKDDKSTLHPQFMKDPQGLLMTAYQASEQDADSKTYLQAVIDYQRVNGLQIPKSMSGTGTYNDQPFTYAFEFTGCTVSKR